MHGVNPLIQDDYLIKRAFILTQKKLTNFKSEDFLYKDGEDLGIIFEKSEKKIDVEKLIDNWYNENRNYNFIEPIELECNKAKASECCVSSPCPTLGEIPCS